MPRNPETSVVLFDLGRVVVDVDKRWAEEAWGRATGRSDFSAIFFDSGIKDDLDVGRINAEEGLTRAARLAGPPATRSLVRDCFNQMIRARPRVRTMATELARRYRIGVISNTDPVHAAWIEDNTGFDAFVEHWTYSFDVGAMKPGADLFVAALEAMEVPGDACVLLDDRADNCATARGLGIDAIRFESFEQAQRELVARGMLTP